MSEQELILVPAETALEVFTTTGGIDPYLAKVRAEIDAFVPDVSTKKGRDEVASIAYKVARVKTYLDGVGKELNDKQKEIPKKIDASRKLMRDTLDAWKDEVRKPLTDWEDAETARILAHNTAIVAMAKSEQEIEDLDSEELAAQIKFIKAVELGPHWEEFEAEAARVKDATIKQLETALAKRKAHEAEQAELARLRAEAVAREQAEREACIAREAEERAKAQAEAALQAERESAARREAEAKAAAERRELELKLQAEKAEREKLEAEQRAANAAKEAEERVRREAEQKAAKEAAETAVREADKKHKASVNRAAATALVKAGLTEDQAKLVITAIAKGEVPKVSISY